MVRVRIRVGIASPTWAYAPGQVVELDDELADKWIASGIAEEVDDSSAVEEATGKEYEKATTRKRRKG